MYHFLGRKYKLDSDLKEYESESELLVMELGDSEPVHTEKEDSGIADPGTTRAGASERAQTGAVDSRTEGTETTRAEDDSGAEDSGSTRAEYGDSGTAVAAGGVRTTIFEYFTHSTITLWNC